MPFDILPADKILAYKDDNDDALYNALLSRLQDVSILPTKEHYHLCAVFIFFTYLSEASPYYPYLWFFGLPERGKSRIVKAMCTLSYRGFYTETLNEAYIFRFADLFRGTLALDLYEISERAQRKGSHDLLLGRYERGMKVARVIAPDKGPFLDTRYFSVSGPTILASNVEISVTDPLRGRCIKITMPEARGIYPNNNSYTELEELKARLLAFRGRHMGRALPEVEKPTVGRLGDVIQPLLCVARLLPGQAEQAIIELIKELEEDRRDTESESLAERIAQAIYDLQDEVVNDRLPVERVREKINEGIDERVHKAFQTIGRELSAMGIKRKKSYGKM